MHKTAPAAENCLDQSVHRADINKPWFRIKALGSVVQSGCARETSLLSFSPCLVCSGSSFEVSTMFRAELLGMEAVRVSEARE